jgi:hypothetical protein
MTDLETEDIANGRDKSTKWREIVKEQTKAEVFHYHKRRNGDARRELKVDKI